ncbi:MAG: hypothetical protein KKF93_06065 [Candidatus Omnitrophica bacterium]|nr:hypothetical protein [Candidatus Omnitrophota bacterium]
MKKVLFIIFLTIVFAAGRINSEIKPLYPAAAEYAPVTAVEQVVSSLKLAQDNISLEVNDIDIKDALKFLATKSGINIVPTSGVTGRVTLMIKDASIQDVFEILIRSNDLAYERVGTIYNVMSQKEYKERYGRNFGDIREVKIFHLDYVIPEKAYNVADSMKSSIGKVLVDSDSGSIVVLDTPEKISQISGMLDELERKSSIQVFNLRYANAKDIAKQLKSQLDMKNVGSIKADARTNQLIVQTLPERMKDIEKIIQQLDAKTKEVLIDSRIIQIKLTDNLDVGVQWEGLFNLGQTDDGTLTYLGTYPFSSVAAATNTDWRSRKDTLNDVGYAGSYPFSGTTTDFAAGQKKVAGEEMHVGVVGKQDYDFLLKYLKTLGEVRILSNPKLAVTNNQEARIHVGERQAYITTTTTAGQTTTTVVEQVTYMDVGLQLFITPIINDEGYVTLNIKPEVSSIIGTVITGQNNKIPIVDTSTAETTVLLKDGATVAIGGLRRQNQTMDSRRIPILSRIPLLGTLFKSESKGSARTELLILVTAHIIEGDELATGFGPDIGQSAEKKYQDYKAVTHESDLTVYEEKHKLEEKTFQPYPEYTRDEKYYPDIKPLKDE